MVGCNQGEQARTPVFMHIHANIETQI